MRIRVPEPARSVLRDLAMEILFTVLLPRAYRWFEELKHRAHGTPPPVA